MKGPRKRESSGARTMRRPAAEQVKMPWGTYRGIYWGTYWGHIGYILGVILGLYWGYIGDILIINPRRPGDIVAPPAGKP